MKPGSLFSLEYFHTTFFEFYAKYHHSFLLFEDCCEFCEDFIQYLADDFGDEKCQDYEIIEALYEFSSQQKIRNISFFDTKDPSEHTSTPFIEDEINRHPNSHEEIGPSQNSEIACTEKLSSEPFYGDDHLLLQGNNEHKVVFLNSCDNEFDIIPVNAHEESNILEVVVTFKVFHENPKPCLFDERYEDSHSLVFSHCYFSGFLFQEKFCEDQDEVSDEMHEHRSLDIHHSYVSPTHPFSETLFQGKIHANHNFEVACVEVSDNVIMVENNHQTLKEDYEEERNDKEEDVLEPLAHDDFPPGSENEEFSKEEEFVPDPVDMDTYDVEKVAPSNAYFQEHIFLFPDASEKHDEYIFFLHLEKYFRWKIKGVLVFLLDFKIG